MTESVIQTSGLTKVYKGITALNKLSIEVPKNSIFGFLGPNGAGKTTTMKLLLGLINPTSGGGTVFGLDIREQSVEIRSRIGYLPQDPRFYEYLTARQVLDFVARFYFKGPEKEIRQRVEETLELVGLINLADRKIKSFSGGERQRLGIAQAQVNYPDLLILDEPAASLDPLGRRDVLDVMERLKKYTTIFYSTHILDDVQQVSEIVAILNHGELVAHGPIQELLAGTSGVVYAITIEGEVTQALSIVRSQTWVKDINVEQQDSTNHLLVTVSDEAAAKSLLLRLIMNNEHLIVTEFGRKRYELEEVFIDIIEGDKHVRQ